MSNINALNNKGIQYFGDESALNTKQKTLIVVGIARGGTSAIAGSLHHLGLFTGSLSTAPVFEDTHLSTPLENKDFKKAQSVINSYNEEHPVWGFKRPAAINYLPELHSMLRNPIYLFVFKDIFSISNRNNISMRLDILYGLKKAHDDYAKILDFIENNKVNGFLFSYEKIMTNKDAFIEALSTSIGQNNITLEQKQEAFNFIEPNPTAYLNASRITRSEGRIGLIETNRVVGWGKFVHTDRPVEVELYINNKLIATQLATQFRENVLRSKKHSTGKCGFAFGLKDTPLQTGDKVDVKVKGDVLFLEGSGKLFDVDV